MVRGLWSRIYHHQAKRVWEKGLAVKGKSQGAGSRGGMGVGSLCLVGQARRGGGAADVICGIGGRDSGGLYAGHGPGEGAISSMAGVWVNEEVPPCGGDAAQSHGVWARGAGPSTGRWCERSQAQTRAGLHKPKRLKTTGRPGGSG